MVKFLEYTKYGLQSGATITKQLKSMLQHTKSGSQIMILSLDQTYVNLEFAFCEWIQYVFMLGVEWYSR